MNYTYHPADQRWHADLGRLQSRFSFSFASYYNPEMMWFWTLRVLNDDIVAWGRWFGAHPHDNMEIISIPTRGVMVHQDSMGYTWKLVPWDVQIISAGSGIEHSELNGSDQELAFFQVWIEPKQLNITPRYQQRHFQKSHRHNIFQPIVSPDGRDGSLTINQDAYIRRVDLDGHASVSHTIQEPGHGRYLFVIEWQVRVDTYTLIHRDGLSVMWDQDVSVHADTDAELLIFEIPMS